MPRVPLTEVKTSPTLWQKLTAGATVGKWSRAGELPTGSERAGFYAAVLAGRPAEGDQTKIARALAWSDLQSRCFRPACFDAYTAAAEAFPNDDKCTFFVAALYHHGLAPASAARKEAVFGRLMRREWRKSAYWNRLDLPRVEILKNLAGAVDEAADGPASPDQIAFLEAAFEMTSESDRGPIACRLARAYRAANRTDVAAAAVYHFLFQQAPEDRENGAFLAQTLALSDSVHGSACAVYARMVAEADAADDSAGADGWAVRLAQAYLGEGRVDADSVATYRRSLRLHPDDVALGAALAYAIARTESLWKEDEGIAHLAAVAAAEAIYFPHFEERGWSWPLVPRALALIWGEKEYSDAAAVGIYARAVELWPGEKTLWQHYAKALAGAEDHSLRALPVYERALASGLADDAILIALGRAYAAHWNQTEIDRGRALTHWEQLYRQNLAWPELRQLLGDELAREGRTSEVALALWEDMARDDKKNGLVRVQMARVFLQRADYKSAVRWYKEAARLMPEDFETQLECAMILKDQTTDAAGAAKVLLGAIELPEGHQSLPAHFALGEALLALDRRDDAKRVFQKIVDEMDPGHTQTLLYLGRLNLKYEQAGVARAEELFERAASQDPNNPETYRRLADLYREKGQADLEQQALEKYLELSEASAEQYRQLAGLYIRRGDYDRAESALRQIIALGDGDKKTYILLGEVLQARAKAA